MFFIVSPEPKTTPPVTPKPTTIAPEPLEELKCLFVGDMFNFAVYREKYDKEVAFISSLGDYFFANKAIKPMAGVWAYGWTNFP
ncbi:unnamed protein product, partial [Strongylus vulgaris]